MHTCLFTYRLLCWRRRLRGGVLMLKMKMYPGNKTKVVFIGFSVLSTFEEMCAVNFCWRRRLVIVIKNFTTLTTLLFYLQSTHCLPCPFHLGSVMLTICNWCRSASPPASSKKLRPSSERADPAAAAALALSTSEVRFYLPFVIRSL
jgi:hypothetical protein